LWVEIPELVENKIKVKFFEQKAMEIVFIGPGCLHRVRSRGRAVQIAWNFCPKTRNQFESGF